MELPLLSSLLICPVIALVAVILTPRNRPELIRWICLVSSFICCLISLKIWIGYDISVGGIQFEETRAWASTAGISYHLGVDGYTVALNMLNSLVFFAGVLTMWDMDKRVKEFFAFMLLLVIGVYGVFVTLDLFLFFFFYEIAVVPMYPLILVWGSTKKEYAAMKLMLFLLLGSALLFPGLLAIYHEANIGSFDMVALQEVGFSREFQIMIYPMIYIGFGVLAGMFPFHGWSPMGHVAAPAAVSMLHAGVLMKLGAFGVLAVGIRLLPEGATYWAMPFAILATIGVVYGAFVAMRQADFKFVIGFSSVSHMSLVLLGLNLGVMGTAAAADAFNGAVFQMFAHGVMTALFFSTVGYIYDRAHSKMIKDFGGLGSQMPRSVSIFIVAGLCGAGLPGLASFWPELLVFLAAIKTHPIIGVFIIAGLVLTALYILRVFHLAFFGPVNEKWNHLKEVDMKGWQLLPRALLIAVLLFFGFVPRAMLDLLETATQTLAGRF